MNIFTIIKISIAKNTAAVVKPSLNFLSAIFIKIDCISTSALTKVTNAIDRGLPITTATTMPIPIARFLDEYSNAAYLAPFPFISTPSVLFSKVCEG